MVLFVLTVKPLWFSKKSFASPGFVGSKPTEGKKCVYILLYIECNMKRFFKINIVFINQSKQKPNVNKVNFFH